MAFRGGQKGRISIAQSIAMQAPLGIEDQVAEARTKARVEPAQIDLEDLIAKAGREEASRETLKTLAAPVSAQKRVSTLKRKGRLGEIPGFMTPKRNKREAKPPQRYEPTSAEPTAERQKKSVFGFTQQVHVGGQVSHQQKDFVAVYGEHLADMSDAEKQAADLLIRGYDNALKTYRMTSARAYTGMSTATGEHGPRHMDDWEAEQVDRAALFEDAYHELTRNTPRWWHILRNVILREPDTGKPAPLDMREVGAAHTKYRAKETATAAGVTATKFALIRWLEALQTALARRAQRKENRAALEAAISREVKKISRP